MAFQVHTQDSSSDESLLEARVLATLAYSSQFQSPLTAREVWLRLPGLSVTSQQVEEILNHLVKCGLCSKVGSLFQLVGDNVVDIHLERQKEASSKQASVILLVSIARHLPWVKAVAVTGSLALGAVDADDDIDVMVVASFRRLWLTRLVLLMFSSMFGRRRSWRADAVALGKRGESVHGEVADTWCFNLWLDEASLAVPVASRSLYTAYEVCQARFVFDRGGVERAFLESNAWTQRWLPQYWRERHRLALGKKTAVEQDDDALPATLLDDELEWQDAVDLTGLLLRWPWWLLELAWEPVGDLLDWFAYRLQLLYMRRHMTTEVVSRCAAFFHPRDTRGEIMRRWLSRLEMLVEGR